MPPPTAYEGCVAAAHTQSTAHLHSALSSSAADHPSNTNEDELPPSPAPKPKVSSNSACAQVTQQPAPSVTAAEPAQEEQNAALSPNKRRGSPPTRPVSSIPFSQPEGQTNELTAKRSRHDERPAKVLPSRYELCPVDDIVDLIAHMIGELITTNDAIRVANGGLTRFHSRTAPGISVRDYLHRLARHATLTPPLLLAMVYYIDRLCAMYPEFTINTLTVHRFLITAATVAAKGLSDAFWNNTTYARVGGIRVAELRLLELEFLYRVDWRIVPNPEVLVAYYQGLVERAPGYELDPEGLSDDDELGESD